MNKMMTSLIGIGAGIVAFNMMGNGRGRKLQKQVKRVMKRNPLF